MVWRVGERVTITLIGKSEAVPPKAHEFMLGRTPRTTKTVFGLRQADGFETAFFSGVTIEIVAGSGFQMLKPGEAVITGLSPASNVMPRKMELDQAGATPGFSPPVCYRGTTAFSL